MDGWVIALLAGGAVVALLVVLLGVVLKAAARTAATAQAVLVVLEELKANTAPLADLSPPNVPGPTTGAPAAPERPAGRDGDGAGG